MNTGGGRFEMLLRTLVRHWATTVMGLLVLILLIGLLFQNGTSPDAREPSPDVTTTNATGGPAGSDGLGVVALDDLPDQAQETVRLIRAGGPYPYRQDDSVFRNREGLLPDRQSGYYREYTVPTQGADDRGERRIVKARDGTLYYTDDHYESFARIRT